jgi:hypothetical protein
MNKSNEKQSPRLRFDLNEGSCYSLHVRLGIVEGDPAAPNWILVLSEKTTKKCYYDAVNTTASIA